MCGYDPFWIYDWLQDRAYEMDELGIDSLDEYYGYLEDLKNDTQVQAYESIEGR